MRHAVPRRRLQRRGFITFLTAVVLAVAGPFGLAAPAFAAIPGHTAGGEFTSFAIDGNRAGPNDWNAPYGPGLTPQGRPTTGLLDLTQNPDDVCGAGTETSYTGKLNDNPWAQTVSNVNTKDDICSGGSAYEVVDVDGQYHYVLYQSMARDPQGSGDMSMLSILEGPIAGRSDDILLEFDFAPNTGTASLTSYRWNGSSWIESAPLVAFQWAQGPNPDYPSANPATFVEYAVDLTANNLMGDGSNPDSPCGAFTVAGMLTRTGNSIQAELQDRFAFADPVVINNCSTVNISKVASPDVASNAVFTYELNQSDGAQVYSSNLQASGGGVLKAPVANNMIRSDIQIGDTHTWSNVIAEPDYQLRETVLPDGWQLMNITCTWYNPFTGQIVPSTIVYQNDDPATPANEAIDIDFQIPPSSISGMQTSCVITNRTSGLVVAKAGAGDTNVPFAFTATGKPGFNLTLGDTSDVLNYTPGTSVTISETLPLDTPSWTYAGTTCVTPGQPDQVFSPQVAVTVTTVPGQVTTCTFTNNQAGQIVVAKDGRGKTPTDTFGFDTNYANNAVAPDGTSDFSLMIGQSNASPELAPGEYTVAELLGAANVEYDPDYALVNIACTITTEGSGASSATGYLQGNLSTTVTLAAGDIVTCTFTNDQQGRLIVKKTTTLRDGTFSFDGRDAQNTQVLTGSITTVNNVTPVGAELAEEMNPGVYSVTESTAEQFWTKVSATCVDGTDPLAGTTFDPATGTLSGIAIQPGHIVTCTFNNAKQTADVRVAKTLTPAADPGLFDLSINANVVSPAAGVGNGYVSGTVQVVLGEQVSVSEAAHTGTNMDLYSSVLVCDNGIAPADNTGTSGNFVVTSPDVTVTCTFQNTRKSAELTLTKAWVNGLAGDTASLTASGSSGLVPGGAAGSSTAPDTTSPAVLTIYAGETVTLSELLADANGASYTAALACSADGLTYTPLALSGAYQVPVTPVPVTCTFTNTRTSAVVTLQKHWTNAAAGDTADLDITATLGQTPADGATSTADGTAQFTDTTNVVTANVLSGETIQLAEVLGAANIGAYTSSLSCNAGPSTAGTTGSYTMPKTAAPVTCTFTNNRTSVELVLEKEWINGAAGDAAELAVTSTFPGSPETSVSAGIEGSEVDSPVKTVTVLSGETVGLSEVLDAGNDAAYANSLVCTGVEPTYQPEALTGSLVVPKDATTGITCRWVNEAGRGTIVIVKNVEGEDGTFDFSGDWSDPETGEVVNGFQLTTENGTASQTWSGVVVPKDGSPFTVTEFDPTPEYDGTALTCVGSLDGDTSSAAGMVGTIDLDPGETVTCTYTNTQRSTIVIIKDADPNDDQDFLFTTGGPDTTDPADWPGTFTLDDDADATLSNTFTSGLLPANATYTVNETAVPGWTLDTTASVCSNQAAVTANGVSLTPTPGQTITCTFVNRAAPASVTVTKTVEGVADDYAWAFDIAIAPVETGVVSPQEVSGTGNTSDSVTFQPLVLNKQYTITEPGLPDGWTQGAVTCTGLVDEDTQLAGFQFTVTTPGQAITCSLTNTATPGEVEVTKTVTGVMDDFEWSIPFTINPVPAGQDATQNATTADPTVGWTGLLTGEQYTLTEQVPDGWTGGAITCTVTHADNTTDNVEGTFTIEAGDSVACAVTNEVLPGELTIIKNTVGGNGSFDFTVTGAENGVVVQETIVTADGTGSTTVPLVPGVHYTVTEVNPGAGWTMGDFVCTLNNQTVTVPFTVGADDDISCSITNTAHGRIIVVKNVDGADGTFEFDGSWTSGSPALVDGGFDITTTAGTGNATFNDVAPGTYSVTELDPAPEYDGTGLTCVGSLDGDTSSATGMVGTIDLDPGETVTCTYTNTQRSTIVIIKDADPNDDQDFAFTTGGPDNAEATAWPPSFILDDDADATLSNTFTSGLLPANATYTVNETAVPGWTLDTTASTCTNQAAVTGTGVELTPTAGQTITCIFVNRAAPASITVTKTVEGVADDYAWEFSIAISPVEAGVVSPQLVSGTGNTSDSVAFQPLVLNKQYTITEPGLPVGWTQSAITCTGLTDEDPQLAGFQITVTSPAQAISCSLTNTAAPGEVEVTKTVTGVLDDFQWSIPFTINPVPAGQDATQSATTGDPTVGWTGLLTGEQYTLTEQVPDGWTGGAITCVITHADDSTDEVQGTFIIEAGDSVACAVTNQVLPGELTIIKNAVGGNGSFDFTITGEEDGTETQRTISTVDGTGSATVPLVPGVHYTVTEVNPGAGWAAGDLVCTLNNQSVTVPFVVGAGDDISCSITNTAQGKIVVVKNVEGVDGSFEFDGDWTSGTPALVDGGFGITTEQGTGQATFINVAPGTYSVSEMDPAPLYDGTGLTCVGSLEGDTSSSSGLTGTIDLDAGETVTCTYTNTQRSSIVIIKDADPNDDQDFLFSTTGTGLPPSFTLDDDGDATLSNTFTSGLLPANATYTVSESAVAGWTLDLQASMCSNQAPVTADGVSLTPAPGQTITCTFVNRAAPAGVTVTKAVEGVADDYAWAFNIAIAPVEAGVVSPQEVSGVGNSSDSVTFEPLVLNKQYTITEPGLPVGWTQSDFTCVGLTDEDPQLAGFQFTVTMPGQAISCSLTNTATPGEVEVTKTVTGVMDDFEWSIPFTISPVPAGQDATQNATTADPTVGWTGLLTGEAYTLTEQVPDGWTGGAITCTVTHADDTTEEVEGTFTIEAGDSVACAVTNQVLPGELTIIKNTVGGNGSFDFTITGEENGVETERTIETVDGTGTATVQLVPGVHYTVTEVNPGSGWTAGEFVCTLNNQTVTVPFTVGADDDISCSITNTAHGRIIIVKNVDGADGTFEFDGNWTSGTPALVDGGFDITTTAGTGNATFNDVAPGTYSVTELDPTPGYDGTGLTCVGNLEGDTSSASGLVGSIDLDPGETVTCTYTNTQRSTIIVIKDAVPNDDQDFLFTTTGGGLPPSFILDDDGDATLSNTFTSGLLPANATYTVSEAAVPGWTLDTTASSCTNQSVVTAEGVSLTPAPGQTITCTLVNRAAPASVTVTKTVEGVADDYGWSFNIAIAPVETGVVSPQEVSGTGNTSDSVTFQPLVLNKQYSISEPVLPDGWTQGPLTCVGLVDEDAQDPGFQFTVTMPGQAISCSLTNTAAPGGVEVTKSVMGVMDDFEWSIPFTISPVPAGQDATQSATTADPTVGWTGLLTGEEYTLTEQVPDGWTGGAITCVVTHADDTTEEVAGTFTIAAGDSVACAVTNQVLPGELTIIKNAVGGNGTFDFTITGEENGVETERTITTVDGTGSTTVPLVPGVHYTVTEVDPGADWTMGGFVCTLNEETVTVPFVVGADDDISCSITNTAKSRIIIVKDAVPNDDQDFLFTATGSGLPESFSLDDDGDGTLSNTFTSDLLTANATYTVAEAAVAGWTLDTAASSCSNQAAVTADGVSLTPAPGQTITCTFVNRADPGTVTVTKTVEGVADDYAWSFEIAISPVETGVVSTQTVSGTGDGTDSVTFEPLVLNKQYTITEPGLPVGWTQSDFTCVGLTDEDAQLAGFQFTVTMPGQAISCSLTNTATPGEVEVTKTVTGVMDDFEWSIPFTINPVPAGQDATQNATTADPTVGWTGLLTGEQYTLTEQVPDGWTGGAITCTVTHADDSTEEVAGTFIIEAGDTVACAVTNEVLPGELTIIKNTVGGNGEFDFTVTGEENGVETERTITTVDGTGSTTVPLVPGVTYTVTEVNPGSGWTMGDFVCTLNEETVTVPFTVGADDDISCSITNTAKGRIIIVKNARSAEDTPPTFGFDGSWTSGSPALVDGGFSIETSPIADPMPEGPNVSGQAMFVDVTPGSYTVTEDDTMPEYSSRIVQCTDGEHNVVSSGVDGPTKTGNINVDPGETVTCVFENTQTATVIVDKVTVPATDMTEFEFEWFLQASEFGEDFTLTGAQDPKVFTGVNPDQDWGLRELAKDGWRFLGVECTLDGETFDGATIEGATVGLDPEPGDVITCTFTNGKRGPVVIEKDVTSGPVKNADGSYTVTYDVTVTSGSSVTEQYTLDDELAFGGGITVVSATVASSDAAVNAAWNGTAVTAVTTGSTTINPGATHTFTVTTTSTIAPATGSEARNCTLGEGETGTGFLNTAELTVTDGPGGEAEACVPAPDEADVSIVKTGTQKVQLPATGGSARIDYTLTVSNAGPTAARDVVVTDTLPAEVKAETVSSSVGTCTNSTTTFTCTLGLVEVGQTITITVVASISNYNGNGPFTNVATVTTSTPETKTENNKSVHVTTVERAALAVTGAGFGQWLWPATALILTGALLVVAVRPKRRRGYRVA
ncbi:DUF11 domain-containing protein [Pseudarthrobacter sp. J47]|uniref:DUF11 domain-containing protein n=1 Tax=Pseudarthrobacter sp. J47 TaxID=3116482 RepID=UPI002E8170A8|nr:DUF11 domain-containing protein [Pseudarthrobacter sp. J47]MEE2524471.1 DUF11 domain-containing protein [Pseudarthrobacter sp. J47]